MVLLLPTEARALLPTLLLLLPTTTAEAEVLATTTSPEVAGTTKEGRWKGREEVHTMEVAAFPGPELMLRSLHIGRA